MWRHDFFNPVGYKIERSRKKNNSSQDLGTGILNSCSAVIFYASLEKWNLIDYWAWTTTPLPDEHRINVPDTEIVSLVINLIEETKPILLKNSLFCVTVFTWKSRANLKNGVIFLFCLSFLCVLLLKNGLYLIWEKPKSCSIIEICLAMFITA